MEAQQIRLNIHELADGIEDEALLIACFEAMKGITQAYRKLSGQSNGAKAKQKAPAKTTPGLSVPKQAALQTGVETEKSQPHDLSLVLLANEVFKGSEAAPPEASIAFRRGLLKSATYEPTLPNRR